MTLDAFRARLGVDQGRVIADGSAAFVLGARTPGRTHTLVVGDHAEIVQRLNVTDADLVRVTATCAMPAVPSALRWSLTVRVDGAVLAERVLPSGRAVVVRDLAANVARLTGEHDVAVRLELVAA